MRILARLLSLVLILGLGGIGLLSAHSRKQGQPEPAPPGRAETPLAHPSYQDSVMSFKFKPLLLTWILLLLLVGVEFAVSFLQLDRSLRPLVMIPGVLMVAIVAISFMEVGKGPTIVRGFAVAAIFWLIVLLGLGSADPLTRTNYLVQDAQVN